MAETTSRTPRTAAIKAELRARWPDSALYDDTQKLLYYMQAAEAYGQECGQLEREIAVLKARVEYWTDLYQREGRDHLDTKREAAQLKARYDCVRALNVPQFQALFVRCIQGERFDDMVDAVIRARAAFNPRSTDQGAAHGK